jgi:hypothetical protein
MESFMFTCLQQANLFMYDLFITVYHSKGRRENFLSANFKKVLYKFYVLFPFP